MRRISRTIAMVVLVTMCATLLDAPVLALPTILVGHPARCHGGTPAPQTPAPVSYQCCVSGHHWAIPGPSDSHRPLIAQLSAFNESRSIPCDLVSCFVSRALVLPSSSPPSLSPLRI